jgi:hypothetical protein
MPKMSKSKEGDKKDGDDKLVTLAFVYKEQALFRAPSLGWLNFIESRCNEIVGNYLVKEN